jgi:hypothetical protein
MMELDQGISYGGMQGAALFFGSGPSGIDRQPFYSGPQLLRV